MFTAPQQGLKKMAGTVGTQITDAKKYVFSMGRRTTSTATKAIINPKDNSSLMANTLLWAHLIPPMPLIASTMYRYYAKGPPAKSWTLTTDITIAIIRDFLNRSSKITVEDIQKISTTKKLPVPSGMQRRKFTVPNAYRKRAGDILRKSVFTKKDKDRISWDWEQDRESLPPIKGEWLQAKGNPLDPRKESTILYFHGGAYYLGCYGVYRQFLGRLVRYSKGRSCSIDYRLAPQHPFPAAVEDALATYLYLIDPPKNEESQPIDPQKIVIAGDSAGGGLTFALLMAIRDAGLPAPAGAMTLSPWLDLTHSLPSILTNIMTDYLPPTGFKHKPSPALDYAQLPAKKEDEKILAHAEAEADDHLLSHPEEEDRRTSIGPFGKAIPVKSENGEDNIYRVHFYAANNELKIPTVSPIFDRKHLRGFPRLLIQCGSAERLRDESVYTALLASNQFPGADTEKILGKPAHVTLELYTDQPHVFQLLFSTKQVSRAMKNLAAFVRDVTCSPVHEDEKKGEPLNYLSDDLLTIRQVNPRGKMTDIKQEFLHEFTIDEWTEWKKRLARTSLRERLNDVTSAFDKALDEV